MELKLKSKLKLRIKLSILFLSLVHLTAYADSLVFFTDINSIVQQSEINGTVKDTNGNPLLGVNVIKVGQLVGVVTDFDGNFTINASQGDILEFSYLGMKSVRITIQNNDNLNIILEEDLANLDEVVVIGYGSVKKSDLTGAVSIVDVDELENKSVTTIAGALQGLATGVKIRGGGRPGSSPTISIRGISSLTNNNPLYVIDGFPTDGGRDFNPNDVESIQILKDASAAAIYGSRAANGVIIITTKSGKEGPMKIDISGRSGIQQTPLFDIAGRDEYIRLNNMAYENAGIPFQDHRPGVDTDWQDETFQTGYIHDYNLNLSGGDKNGKYMVSGNYFKNDGVIKENSFERISFRVNTKAKRGIFNFGQNLSISNSFSDDYIENPYWDVLRMLPTIPVYDETNPGGYGYGDGSRAKTFGTNPIARNALTNSTFENFRVRGNIFAEFNITNYLKYKANFGLETSRDHSKYTREKGTWKFNQPQNDPSYLSENRAKFHSTLIENTINFDKEFGNHSINAVVGITYQKFKYNQLGGSIQNLLQDGNENYFFVMNAGQSNPQSTGFILEHSLASYLGRVNYSFSDKYLLTGTIRRDGSSKFMAGQRWGTFPSVSGAWRISKEDFFNISWIDDLKIRANYGTLGSVNIGEYDYLSVINTFPLAVFDGDKLYNGAIQVQLSNENLKWETLKQSNFGVDASLLGGKLFINGEYYVSRAEDILYSLSIPLHAGHSGANPVVNAASIRNSGFELSATWKEVKEDFKFNLNANLTTIKNEVISLGYEKEEHLTSITTSRIGEPIGMWYLIETNGLFQSQEEILNHKNSAGEIIQPDAQPGDIRFVDFDDDGMITSNDRQVMGNPDPDFELGLNFSGEWKNFNLEMNWFASVGQKVFNHTRQMTDRFDDNSNYRSGVQPWTPQNTNTEFPRIIYASTLNSKYDSDRWLENGSFLRLKTLSMGYTIPSQYLKSLGMSSAKIYITGENLLTFTKYLGLDPEFQGGGLYERGRDSGAFPNLKSMSLGFKLKF